MTTEMPQRFAKSIDHDQAPITPAPAETSQPVPDVPAPASARTVIPGTGYAVAAPGGLDPAGPRLEDVAVARFCRKGEYWMVSYGAGHSLLQDRKGLRYIAYLLCYPQREIHVLDLVNAAPSGKACQAVLATEVTSTGHGLAAEGIRVRGLGDAGQLLDNQARIAYRRRLAELAEQLARAKEAGNEPRAALLESEQEAIASELRGAFGRNGRPRPAADAAEKARVNVTRTLKLAIEHIAGMNPPLGRHFKGAIRTGYCCSYRPDPDRSISWQL